MLNFPQDWHYISPIEADGQTQMAIDEWLLNQHLAGEIPSVLRFYTWNPVAISLGYHQRKYPETWHHLTYQNQPIDIVRRPSGGRAVLHQGELTYALITSNLQGDRCQAYKALCQFLINGFQELGMELEYGDRQRNYTRHDNCFRTQTNADLVTPTGYKLIGSAQLRRKQAILQHGSIRLNPDATLYQHIFGETLTPPNMIKNLEIKHLINHLKSSFQTQWQVTLKPKEISGEEWQKIHVNKSTSILCS